MAENPEGSEPRGRRSKFGDAPRKSGFDRRSRSPNKADNSDSHRSRSPQKSADNSGESSKKGGIAAAMEAAARINAQLQANKAPQHVDVPPVRAVLTPVQAASAGSPSSAAQTGTTLNTEVYQQDGDFIKDIEINDLRNRYTLTKGSTQKMIKDETGADVTTRGNYCPDKSLATPANPPLYLHVTSTTKEGLEQAVKKIQELMSQELPNLIDERRFRRRDAEPFERDERGRRKWPEERIPIDLEPVPGFNLRAQVVGHQGSYVKHIQQETGCRVQIKGRGSGFYEHETGRESDDEMFLHVAGPEPEQVAKAKQMAEDLLNHVREAYHAHKERPPRGGMGGPRDRGSGSYGGDDNYRPHNNYGGQSQYGGNSQYGDSSQYGGGYGAQGGYAGAQSPSNPAVGAPGNAAAPAAAAMDPDTIAQYQAWVAYYAQNPSEDPYAQYGGYAAMMAQYLNPAGYQQPGAQAQSPPPGQNGAAAPPPPPPPPAYEQPPPPPPPGAASYSKVPPPPGM